MDKREVFSSFFFRCYAALWWLAYPFLRLNKRLSDGWAERCVDIGWASRVDVWLQAASGGEAHLALALLNALPEDMGAEQLNSNALNKKVTDTAESKTPRQVRVLVTTWTRQGRDTLEAGREALEKNKPWVHLQVRFAPLDMPSVVRRAFAQAKPRLLVLLETELWPGLLGGSTEAGVPVHIYNGRLSKLSLEYYRMIKVLFADAPLQSILAISPEDAQRFQLLLGKSPSCTVELMPNIKFDRALEHLRQAPACGEWTQLFQPETPIILLASIRQQEERRVAPVLEKLRREVPNGIFIIVPRHMHRVQPWFERLNDLGLAPVLTSTLLASAALDTGQIAMENPDYDQLIAPDLPLQAGAFLVWDRFGDLPALYALASATFVGGSLSHTGGQNFLEALTAGRIPCVGPHLDNFHWALGNERAPNLSQAGLLDMCKNTKGMAAALQFRLQHQEDPAQVRENFRKWLLPRLGGVKMAAEHIRHTLATLQEG